MNLYNMMLILGAVLLSVVPIPLIKKYLDNKNDNNHCLIFAIIAHILLIFAYIMIFKNENAISTYPIIKILSIIFVVIFGIIYLDTKLTFELIVGILLGLISIYLLC